MPPLMVETLHSLARFLGREIGTTEWFVVTQELIQRFAETTEDRQWIHLDRERTQRDSAYGTTIAHGFLTLALLSHFLRQCIQIQSGVRMSVNYGLNRVRFMSPVHVGKRIRGRAKLISVEEVQPNVIQQVSQITVEIEGEAKPAMVAESVTRTYLEPQA